MFYVGQQVVCIEPEAIIIPPLILNKVYVIEKMMINSIDKLVFSINDGSPFWWNSTRFRPVIERKTDISIFTEMLNKDKVGV